MAYRGTETIHEVVELERDADGDPIEGQDVVEDRPIKNCQLIPRTHPDDKDLIIDGWQVFVPPESTPPSADSLIKARSGPVGSPVVLWNIDGNIGAYDKKGVPKGAFFTLERVAGISDES